ncbi:MAG: hypothetical protein LBF37_03130 [Rickettsiales bacterium]|nr:hypothetical protein [Rickettsiales bacterium]
MLNPGEYRIIAVGPGGDGAKGGTTTSHNNSVQQPVYGALGAGGGAGGYVFSEDVILSTVGFISFTIHPAHTELIGSVVQVNIPQAESGSSLGGEVASVVSKAGNSQGVIGGYIGSRGGGPGGTRGSRTASTVPTAIPGGLGDYGNGDTAVIPSGDSAYRTYGQGGVDPTPPSAGAHGQGGAGGAGGLGCVWIIALNNQNVR